LLKQERTKTEKDIDRFTLESERLKGVKLSLQEAYDLKLEINQNKEIDVNIKVETKLTKDRTIQVTKEISQKKTTEEKLRKEITKQETRIKELQAKEAELLEDLNTLNNGELPKKKKFLGIF
jgi:chromosome segregation ATPase